MTSLPNKELLRPDEVADYLRVHRKTVYEWLKTGKLKGKKISNRNRIFRQSVIDIQKPIEDV